MTMRNADESKKKMRTAAAAAAAAALVSLTAVVLFHGGCLVTQTCYSNEDCSSPEICLANGSCGYECTSDEDCGDGMGCDNHMCRPKSVEPIECPDDMVNIAEAFCIDRFEASRPDATSSNEGKEGGPATSREGVLPWQVPYATGNETARKACQAAGKDLCSPQQWRSACEGKSKTVYGYGNAYEPETCNGIDTFGRSGFHLLPTGALPHCKSDWGVYDINGNLWEHTLDGNNRTIRGGAYNCIDSQTLHRCDYIPGNWEPTARGFRCCLVPSPSLDAGLLDAIEEVGTDTQTGTEVGCLDPDVLIDVPIDVPIDVSQDIAPDFTDAPTSDAVPADVVPADAKVDVDMGLEGCPSDMARIKTSNRDFCMDVYEASRIDATAYSVGALPMASSRKGVLPWHSVDLQTARDGCIAAGKRLCGLDEWVEGCSGPGGWIYGYGNTYDPVICNGIDTLCDCDGEACGNLTTCPYPHCFSKPSSEGGGPCGGNLWLSVTGSFPDCHSPYGIYDINGNLWELADTDDGLEHFRGGAYNCLDSQSLHRCDHDGTWGPTARGFRCCKDPE